jgi:hypothetical protein
VAYLARVHRRYTSFTVCVPSFLQNGFALYSLILQRTMKSIQSLLLLVVLLASASAFAPTSGSISITGGSAFVTGAISHRRGPSAPVSVPRGSKSQLYMGGKMSKFGVFSPAVYGAKLVLGTEKLNKLRGKAISLHSQYIGDFCEWVGAYHLRTKLIKKAKTNGDTLGFLV